MTITITLTEQELAELARIVERHKSMGLSSDLRDQILERIVEAAREKK